MKHYITKQKKITETESSSNNYFDNDEFDYETELKLYIQYLHSQKCKKYDYIVVNYKQRSFVVHISQFNPEKLFFQIHSLFSLKDQPFPQDVFFNQDDECGICDDVKLTKVAAKYLSTANQQQSEIRAAMVILRNFNNIGEPFYKNLDTLNEHGIDKVLKNHEIF